VLILADLIERQTFRGNALAHTGDSPDMLPASVRSLDLVPAAAVLRGASPAWAASDTCAGPAAGNSFQQIELIIPQLI
jgi:hypothetical protein